MQRKLLLAVLVVGLLGGVAWLASPGSGRDTNAVELLNVSYDPTRELWRDVNEAFAKDYVQKTGTRVAIKQSHGGSASQARAVIDGLDADVVTLALWSDTDAIRKAGLIEEGWDKRLPHNSLPYFSTIVFVVRKGNPKSVHDWPDLIKPDIAIITPSPKTSGNGKLSFLAAWGSVIQRGGSEEEARAFVTALYRQVPVLDSGARGSTTTFAQKKIGDVHLTWENEAYLEVEESGGELEIVHPPTSIRAEPHVALVDANVRRKGTQAAAEAYLAFLYSQAGQEIIAQHHYRPIDPEVLKKHATQFHDIRLFPVTSFVRDWNEAQTKFFAEGAVFDQIFKK
jgi:sulfate transport system substrate-binding protein